jgi:DNA (cytosine-5)-methyltransferase 1
VKAIELFAGVGGFRLGLKVAGIPVVWSNQWEPGTSAQHASRCYELRFRPERLATDQGLDDPGVHVNDDIERVLDAVEAGWYQIPDHQIVTGGFPCQDYSVAKAAGQAHGLVGRKGVLWWQIHRLIRLLVQENRAPEFLLLENVDRLLKSPRPRRGRDFAIMLSSLNDLGYDVEWRVINAADYGAAQRRRRVFLVASRIRSTWHPIDALAREGVLARSFPVALDPVQLPASADFSLTGSLEDLTNNFGSEAGASPFRNAGVARNREIWTRDLIPRLEPQAALASILVPAADVPDSYVIPDTQLASWRILKGAKKQQRMHSSGTPYTYVEGSIPFPDPTDRPSRTITTSEGGASPSRFRHVVEFEPGRYRRLLPIELERLNGFPEGWTDIGISDSRRAFLMGNALVVGLVARIASELVSDLRKHRLESGAIAS